ncbi:helix-turn-helix domain-containing protein [Niabella sp. 22666]|uniref:helix-turn-helix domain-containing protein n=1 Tax=Niabella sp. 22666 TaxID=3453954 RepID=UPI003F83263C
MNRKEIAGMFRISLVTLREWRKGGLPSHKQGGRVYFLRSEVREYVRQKKGRMSITLKHH